MPYVLISTYYPLEFGPTIVGDESSNEDLMLHLGATLELRNCGVYANLKSYRTPDPPRVVLNKLESLGYRVISFAGDGQIFAWTLHKP